LIKYLVDSLQSFENSHGGALHPIPIDPANFFMGDDSAMKPATSEEVRQLAASVNRTAATLSSTVHSVLSQATIARNHPPPASHIGSSQNYEAWNSQNTAISHQVDLTGSAARGCSVSSFDSQSGGSSMLQSSPPIAGVSIPSLGHAPGAWRRAMKQWTEVDPQTGLALKDWPAKWYTGLMRTTTGSLRSQRQVIFEEYER
jgi:hypothetical protein